MQRNDLSQPAPDDGIALASIAVVAAHFEAAISSSRFLEDLKVTKYSLFAVAILSALLAVLSPTGANAQGFHFGGGGAHANASYSYGSYGGNYGCYPQSINTGNGWGGWGSHTDWHSTSHVDYHQGGYAPHRGHLDYSPGHFDRHTSGHWDTHF
jgi:hypothetical protein